tara:strand:+ start:493 stop:873 length:381 start_codon:yes stop_codon:yes gene_type:complete
VEYLIIILLIIYILYIKKPEYFKDIKDFNNIDYDDIKLRIDRFMLKDGIDKHKAWAISFFIACIMKFLMNDVGGFSDFIFSSLGILVIPAIVTWYLHKNRKWNFGKTLIYSTIIICLISYTGMLLD